MPSSESWRSGGLAMIFPELVMLNHGIEVVVSADRHFDHFSEIRRLDPAAMV